MTRSNAQWHTPGFCHQHNHRQHHHHRHYQGAAQVAKIARCSWRTVTVGWSLGCFKRTFSSKTKWRNPPKKFDWRWSFIIPQWWLWRWNKRKSNLFQVDWMQTNDPISDFFKVDPSCDQSWSGLVTRRLYFKKSHILAKIPVLENLTYIWAFFL